MTMEEVSKSSRIQAILQINERKKEMQNRMKSGKQEGSVATGGNSFTEDEWKKIIQKMDEYLTEVKQEQQERFEKRDKEKEIEQFYQKLEMSDRYKKAEV